MKNICKILSLLPIILIIINVPFVYTWTIGEPGTDTEGWVLNNDGHKYFAIGLWGIPNYTFVRNGEEPVQNSTLFVKETKNFNQILIQCDYQKPYMHNLGKVFCSGLSTFRWKLSEAGYNGTVELYQDDNLSNDKTLYYRRMKSLHDNIYSLQSYIQTEIVDYISTSFENYPLIHCIMDEPDTGGKGWCWSPRVLQVYNDRVHNIDKGGLTYIDLGGTICANRFFYEKAFGDTFKVGTAPVIGECSLDNMDTFNYASDGTSLYTYTRRNKWERRPIIAFKQLFFENIRETASAYGNCADVIGYNSYQEFREFPETIGETVDAIKAGCGVNKPVWLFFDAAAYSKPLDMTYGEYAQLIKCQVYTSIVHGATGVYFFAFTESKDVITEYWPLIKTLAGELQRYSNIVKMPIVNQSWDIRYHHKSYNHLHYSVRSSGTGEKKYLIATNTALKDSIHVNVEGFPQFTLEPLGIQIVDTTTPDVDRIINPE